MHGEAIYDSYAASARELLAVLRKDKDKAYALSLRFLEEFPNSKAARELF